MRAFRTLCSMGDFAMTGRHRALACWMVMLAFVGSKVEAQASRTELAGTWKVHTYSGAIGPSLVFHADGTWDEAESGDPMYRMYRIWSYDPATRQLRRASADPLHNASSAFLRWDGSDSICYYPIDDRCVEYWIREETSVRMSQRSPAKVAAALVGVWKLYIIGGSGYQPGLRTIVMRDDGTWTMGSETSGVDYGLWSYDGEARVLTMAWTVDGGRTRQSSAEVRWDGRHEFCWHPIFDRCVRRWVREGATPLTVTRAPAVASLLVGQWKVESFDRTRPVTYLNLTEEGASYWNGGASPLDASIYRDGAPSPAILAAWGVWSYNGASQELSVSWGDWYMSEQLRWEGVFSFCLGFMADDRCVTRWTRVDYDGYGRTFTPTELVGAWAVRPAGAEDGISVVLRSDGTWTYDGSTDLRLWGFARPDWLMLAWHGGRAVSRVRWVDRNRDTFCWLPSRWSREESRESRTCGERWTRVAVPDAD